MFRFKTVLTGLILLAGTCGSVSAQVIADYRADYLSGTFNGQTRPAVSADGWDYMWNANAAIGTAAGNYSSLRWWGGQNHYNFDGAGNLGRANPAAYVSLHGTGGHPGRGVTDHPSAVFDRYPIAAYTVQPGEGGLLQVANSAISVGSANSTGVELRVYVNDGLTTRLVRSGGGTSSSFDGLLGIVNPGDTVYVAMGPNLDDGHDAFNVAYQLATVTDPLVVVWDADGTLPIDGGAGGWDTASSRWYTGSGGGTYTTWNNGTGMNANFLAAGGAVTLDVPITARSLTFSADGYTISGTNGLTLTNAGSGGPGPNTIDVTGEGATATISAPITGGSLTKVGGGTLVLTGNNTYLGATKIDGGVLTVNGTGAITQTDRLHNRVGGVTLNVANSASITARNYMVLGDYSGASITVNQSGGTVTSLGTANDPGGNNVANRWGHWGGGNTTYNLSSGDLNLLNAPLYLSWDGDAALNVQGGTANIVGINMGYGGRTHNSAINLTSGTLNIGSGGIYTGGTANKNINLGGGTLAASADWSSSMPMTLTGTGGRVRVDTNGHTITLSGDLTGAGGLNKIDDGTLTLSGNTVTMNDYFYVANGTVNLNGSTVTANAGTQIADRFQDNVNPINAVLNINTGSSLTTRFIVGGNGGGSNINGTINQYAGTTVETTGVTAENNGLRLGHYPGGNVTYNLIGGTLTIGDNRDLSAATDGTGWFNQTGGTLNVERIVVNKRGGSGGDGRVTLAGGTANIGAGGIITDSTPSKATLEYGGLGGTVRATASFSSPLDATLFGTGASAAKFDTNGYTITLSGALGGPGQLHKVGAGTLSLTGNNTLASLVVDGGATSVLEIAGSSNTSVAGYVGIGDASFATLQIKDTAQFSPSQLLVGETGGIGGAVEHQGGTVTIAGETRIGHWPNETSTYTLSGTGNLVANGRFSVGWDGSGVFTQDGGSSQFNAGLSVAAHNSSGAATVNMNGGTMNASTLMLSDSSYGKPGTFNQTGGTVTVAGHTRIGHWNGGPSNYNLSGGTLNANGGLFVGWDGVGIMTVSGATTQLNASFIGLRGNNSVMNIQDGTVQTANFFLGEASGRSTTVNQTGGNVTANGQLRIGHYPNETSTYHMDGGTLTVNGSGTGPEQAGVITLGIDGTGILNHSAGTIATQGLYLDARGATGGLDQYNMTGGMLAINGSLGIAGNADTSTYQINLGGGTVKSNATWSSGAPMTFTGTNGNVTFDTNGNTVTLNGLLSGSGGLIKDGAGTLTFNADNTYTGSTVINGGTLVLNTPHFNTYRGAGIFINNGSTFKVTRSGGANRYDFVNKTFTFDSAGGGTIDTSSGVNFVFWNPGNTFVTNGGAQNSIIGTSGFNVNAGAAATFDVTRGSGTSDLKVTARIWNSGSVVKTGDGILEFTGNNTYAGTTAVNAGTLLLNGQHTGGGLYTVAAGATLGGTGTTTSQVDLSGAVAPGTSVGTLNTGSQTWNDGGSFAFEINDVDAGAGTGWDLLNVTGSLDLTGLSNGGFEIDVASLGLDDLPGLVHDFNAGLPYEWEFVRTSDGIAGFQERDFVIDATAFANPLSNIGSFIVYQKGDSLYLGHHVPEPSTLVLAVIGILGLGFVSWRRSSIVSKKI